MLTVIIVYYSTLLHVLFGENVTTLFEVKPIYV